jgi:hypothetical protein
MPLSNGLTLEMGSQAVLERFGAPVLDEAPQGGQFRQVIYREFSASFDSESGRMILLDLRGDTALAGGLKKGSPWSAAVAEFGPSNEVEGRLEVELPSHLLVLERYGKVVGSIQIKWLEPQVKASRARDRVASSRIEPLSNGVFVSGSAEDVLAKLGPPDHDDRRHPAVRLLIYNGLQFQFVDRGQRLNRAVITGSDVSLACGVKVGSTKDSLKRILPSITEGIVGTPLSYSEAGFVVSFSLEQDCVSRIELRRVSGGSVNGLGNAR